MPANQRLDVSCVLDDPMFLDAVTILRNPVGANGESDPTTQVTMADVPAVVEVSERFNLVVMESDLTHAKKSISIWTRTRIYDVEGGVTQSFQPDIIVYLGDQYKVVRVYDYSRWGQGYYAADGEILDLATSVAQS